MFVLMRFQRVYECDERGIIKELSTFSQGVVEVGECLHVFILIIAIVRALLLLTVIIFIIFITVITIVITATSSY